MMKNLKKNMMAAVLACCFIVPAALAGCTEKPCTEHVDADNDNICDVCGAALGETPSEVKDTDGRWIWEDDGFSVILKLKEDNTFYMSIFFAESATAGTWELRDEPRDYYKIASGAVPAEGDDQTKYTADKTLVLTAYDGSVYCGAYADGTIWNLNVGMGTRSLSHEADYDWKEEEEVSVEVVKVSLPKDANANLVLYHTKTFSDQLDGYTEGTWETTSEGYALKDDEGNDHAVITRVENGMCTYTPAGGAAIELYETAWTPLYELKDGAATGEDSYTLKLWEDGSADLEKVDGRTYLRTTEASGTWSDENGVLTPVLGDHDVTVENKDGVLTVTIELSDVTVITSIRLADVYAAEVEGQPSYITVVENSTQLSASNDGTYSLTGEVSAMGAGGKVTYASGTFDAQTMQFTYKTYSKSESGEETEGEAVASPVLVGSELKLIFEHVKMDASAIVPGQMFDVGKVTVSLGAASAWDALADYTAEDITETYTSSSFITVDSADLFMKDGAFAVTFHVTIPAMGATIDYPAWLGTYSEENGVVTFTVPAAEEGGEDTTFTSRDGVVSFIGFTVPNLGATVDMQFAIANKTTTYADINGDVPRQTAGQSNATVDRAYLAMKEGTFTITIDATAVAYGGMEVAGVELFEGECVLNQDGSYTFIVGEQKYVVKGADGYYTFTFGTAEEGYQLMGAFNVGVLTFVFDIA